MKRDGVRYIHSRLAPRQLPALLHGLFGAELLAPSRRLWLISPWITDIAVLDNSAGGFLAVAPSFGPVRVRLSRILAALAERGTIVHVATREDPINRPFLAAIDALRSPERRMIVHLDPVLHEKGLVGDQFSLCGSMNFTHNGVTLNEEAVVFETDPRIVAERQIAFGTRWVEDDA